MRTADSHFDDHAIFRCQATRNVDVEIRQRDEKAFVVTPDRVAPFMVFTPRFIVVPRPPAKGRHDSRQVVRVFPTHMFLNKCKLSARTVTESSSHGSSRQSSVE